MTSKKRIYNLRIVPPNPIYEEVTSFKKTFIEAFGKQPLSKSKPHVTLAIFEMKPQFDGDLVKAFDQLSEISQFQLNITGFGNFQGKHPNVLFLEIPMIKEIKLIWNKTKDLWTNGLKNDIKELTIPTIPHMTISRTRTEEMLEKGLELFRNIDYTKKSFKVENLLLISRIPGNTWDWEHKIQLSNKIIQ